MIVVIVAIIFVFLFLKKQIKSKKEIAIGMAIFCLLSITALTVLSIIKSTEMPIVEERHVAYPIKNGISPDKKFAFFYTQSKLVAYKLDKDGYKQVYYNWELPTFPIDKDLFMVYNLIVREKIDEPVFSLPLQSIEEKYNLTTGE